MITADWVDHWSSQYNAAYDVDVLDRVGPRVRERGYYDRDDFLTVGVWKSPRAKSRMAKNSDQMIHDVTSTAFTAPLTIRHRVLTILAGVGVPMASSLLMVWRPDEHTVIDVRAVKSLVAHQEVVDPTPRMYPLYLDYLEVCNKISIRCGRSLRDVDRALYCANGYGPT